jgi:molybdate transport system permease protein
MNAADIASITLLTLRVASVATLFLLPMGASLGYLLARHRFRGRALLQAAVAVPMVLPPVAVGLGLLLLLSALELPLAFTWWAAVLAACTVSFPLLVRACEQAFAEVDPRFEQVARSLGLGPVTTFVRVSLPLARRGVMYGALLSFTRALGEFGATAVVAGLIPGRTETLALGIYSRVQIGDTQGALALCAASFALALAAMWIAEGWLRRGHPS